MRPHFSIGFEIISIVVSIMQKMSQNNYIIFHLGLIVKLDHIEVAL
jgi:hypothetical protein